MDSCWEIPSTLHPRAEVVVAGAIKEQRPIHKICGPQKSVVRSLIEVGEDVYEVIAYGDLASSLAGCRTGTFVTVDGILLGQRWNTGDGKSRSLAEIHVQGLAIGPQLEGKLP